MFDICKQFRQRLSSSFNSLADILVCFAQSTCIPAGKVSTILERFFSDVGFSRNVENIFDTLQ